MYSNRALKGLILLLIAINYSSCKETSKQQIQTMDFYVGTYTNGESQGIYKYKLAEDGKLEKVGLMARAENPSFLAFDQSKKYLVAVNEVNENGVGYVSGFRIEEDSLVLINKSSSGGAHPCHISINEEGYVIVANYSGGNMGLLGLNDDGSLSDLLDIQQHEGSGSHERQEAPHAHSGWFKEDGTIVSVDLGTNQLWLSEIDPDSLKFRALEPSTFDLEDGAGPRHLAFHPEKNWMYVINELTSSVSLVVKNTADSGYAVEQTTSTLPDDFTGPNTCADIHISSDGKFLYASNRGHNSIAIFAVDQRTGQLRSIGHESTRGDTPRNFTVSPDGEFLLVANQNSNNIISFRRDIASGTLTYTDEIKAMSPVCLVFSEPGEASKE